MKKLNTKGFGAVEALLIIVIIALVAGVGYYVWQQSEDSNDNSKSSQSSEGEEQPTLQTTRGLALNKAALPKGWESDSTEYNEGGLSSISLSAPVSDCGAGVVLEDLNSQDYNSFVDNYLGSELEPVKPGIKITKLAEDKILVNTEQGQKEVVAQTVRWDYDESFDSTTQYRKTALIKIDDKRVGVVSLTCLDEDDFTEAEEALLAIRI